MSYLEELLPEFKKGAKIRMKLWPENEYIYRKGNDILDERGKTFDFTNSELFSDWEFVKDPEPDWDYIIKNKCLCWFWDGNEKDKIMGKLQYAADDKTFFICEKAVEFNYCRPVRRDEITFYEDETND